MNGTLLIVCIAHEAYHPACQRLNNRELFWNRLASPQVFGLLNKYSPYWVSWEYGLRFVVNQKANEDSSWRKSHNFARIIARSTRASFHKNDLERFGKQPSQTNPSLFYDGSSTNDWMWTKLLCFHYGSNKRLSNPKAKSSDFSIQGFHPKNSKSWTVHQDRSKSLLV